MIILLRGPSGVGKTSLAKNFMADDNTWDRGPGGPAAKYMAALWDAVVMKTPVDKYTRAVVSADDFYMKDGEYLFDPRLLPNAHASCMRNFTERIRVTHIDKEVAHHIIVDNTNTTVAEVAPYAALANAYGQELHIVTLVGDPLKCFGRNLHKTPITAVMKQDLQLRQSILEMPPWFPQVVFPANVD